MITDPPQMVEGALVEHSNRSFRWDGMQQVLRFDVKIIENFSGRTLVLRFDVTGFYVRVTLSTSMDD